MEGTDEGGDEVPVFLEEGAITAFTRDALWAAEVQVDSVAVRGDESRGGEEVWRGVGAKLDERRAVRGAAVEEGCLKGLCTVGGGCSEEAGVEHGGIAEGVGGGVPTGEETPGLGGRLSVWGAGRSDSEGAANVFGLLDHGGNDGRRGADGLVELSPEQLPFLCGSLRVRVDSHRRQKCRNASGE